MNNLTVFNKFYLFKDFYFMNSFFEYPEKVPVFIDERSVRYKMFMDFADLLDQSKFVVNTHNPKNLTIFVHYDKTLTDDGYTLDISKVKQIIIRASNSRAVRYAFDTLNNLVEIKDGIAKLPNCLIEDEPSFKVRGVIEGFYGPPWTYENRLELFDFLDKHRMNAYMYAPKVDPYHRNQWYLPYPEGQLNEMRDYLEKCNYLGIDFYYCISPGYKVNDEPGFQYVDNKDFERLFNKLDQLIGIGIKKFGLLLDDIDYKLSGQNKTVFRRPGIAHAYIVNKVNEYLKNNVLDYDLVMCPTEYHQIGDTEYRNDLNEYMDNEVKVYWTGDNVCAEVITKEQIRLTQEAYNKEIFIWDNFPVTDFTYGVRQYMAPIINRSDSLGKYAKGYFSNPMTHYEISKIGMITMAHYAWNSSKYCPDKSFEIAIKHFGEEFYQSSQDYINFNYPNVLSHGNYFEEVKMVQENNIEKIKAYYEKARVSANKMLELDLKIVDELRPWLERVEKEEQIVHKILENKLSTEELKVFLEDIKFSGCAILDLLIEKNNLLSPEDYQLLIKKRRGYPWYRIWEQRR